ncbi:MAG: multidrug effflux MFS transporter [Bacteroidetes bacterium]|nr:multidrug effflux MFS transporter [Bacteroidota bacterium]
MKPKTRLILLLGTIAALGPLSLDLYLSGFPEIAIDLNTPINYVSLSLTAYFIGIAIGQLINGPLLDRFGRKTPLIIGLVFYAFSSIGCSLAPDIYSLIALRFVMALGGSVGMVASRAIIRDHFEHNEIARALSALILVFGLAPILAPMLGSLVLQHFGWRYNFLLLSGYALLISLLAGFFLKESHGADTSYSIKPIKIIASYRDLLRDRHFLVFSLAGCFGMIALFAYISGSSYVLRNILHFDEIQYAYIFGLNAICFIAASQVNRYLLKKYDMLLLSKYVALAFIGLALILVLQVVFGLTNSTAFIVNFILFLSMLGFINPNLQALAMEPYKSKAGSAAALLGSLRMLTGTAASAYISIFHDQSAWPMVSLFGLSALLLVAVLWSPKWTNSRQKLSYD